MALYSSRAQNGVDRVNGLLKSTSKKFLVLALVAQIGVDAGS